MAVYSVSFLAGVLIGLPWLAYRVDVYWPGVHAEIGWGRAIGVAVFAVFFGGYVYSTAVLTRRGRGAYVEFDPPREFVSAGPFRWLRNPVAACLVGMELGLALALSSSGVFLLFLAAIPLAHTQVVYLEEPLLRKRFGAAYEEYMRRVPRWIPRRPRQGAAA